jgi:hypothetical protein
MRRDFLSHRYAKTPKGTATRMESITTTVFAESMAEFIIIVDKEK